MLIIYNMENIYYMGSNSLRTKCTYFVLMTDCLLYCCPDNFARFNAVNSRVRDCVQVVVNCCGV